MGVNLQQTSKNVKYGVFIIFELLSKTGEDAMSASLLLTIKNTVWASNWTRNIKMYLKV